MKLTINKNVILGMHQLSSRDSSRNVLCNTVNLEISGKQCVVVATDGRRLGACSSGIVEAPDQCDPVSLTFEVPVKMLKAFPDQTIVIQFDPASPKKITITGKTAASRRNSLAIDLLEGNFPKWRQVIPEKFTPGLSGAWFNWRLLEGFVKAAEIICGTTSTFNSPGIHVSQEDSLSPIVIHIDRLDFIGVLMPMRKDGQSNIPIPEWAKIPASPTVAAETVASSPSPSTPPNLSAQLS